MNSLDRETIRLISLISENLPDMDGDTVKKWIDNPLELKTFLHGLCPLQSESVLEEETSIDTTIRVDRFTRPTYPDWMIRLSDPSIQYTGPYEYDLKSIEFYLHKKQKSSVSCVRGVNLYKHLKETRCIENCLGFEDALEIQKKGRDTFREIFGNRNVYCWKSVMRRKGDLKFLVPYVGDFGSSLEIRWSWIEEYFGKGAPVALFPKKK